MPLTPSSGTFKTILVPLDGSPEAAAVLPAARTIAAGTGSTIALLRVVPDSTKEHGDTAEVESSLRRVEEELAPTGIPVTHAVRVGNPAETILDEATRIGAGLVAMATHGRGGLQRAMIGSVSSGVLARTPVPLLLLRPGGKRLTTIKRLLVPVDGTPGSTLALGAAVNLAGATDSAIHLLQVVVPFPTWALAADAYTPMTYDPAWDIEARESATAYVNGLAQRLQQKQVRADGRAVEGVPSTTILETAKSLDADLIVMSTHALTGPKRALLGSVADEVVRGSDHPVLLVRQGAASASPNPADAAWREQPLMAT